MKLYQKVGKVLQHKQTKIIKKNNNHKCCPQNLKLCAFSYAHDVKIYYYNHHMYTAPNIAKMCFHIHHMQIFNLPE